MGQIYAEIHLSNPSKLEIEPLSSVALVDTGSLFLCIPENLAQKLQLPEHEKRTVTIADGSKKQVPYVGPIRIGYANRMCLTGALVMGDQILLGAIPIEDMDLVVHPAQLKLTVHPDYPDTAHSFAVGISQSRQ